MQRGAPIPDSYWLHEKLLAGEYPAAKDLSEAKEKVARMIEAGITSFVDLTEAGERGLRPYASLLPSTATHHRFPIPDLGVPSVPAMRQILTAMDRMMGSGEVVYVHCWGGIGRTGTVVGCYLVEHGMSGDDAIAHIAQLRDGTPDGYRHSPETRQQCAFVRSWTPA